MTAQHPSVKAKPRFFDCVWIGEITDIGFIVFDPTIHNLYDEDEAIALWVENDAGWQYFNEDEVRVMLRENLGRITDNDRARIARDYWHWRCEGRGYSKDDYLRLKQEEADEKVVDEFFASQQLNHKPCEEEQHPEDYYLNAVRERSGAIPEVTPVEKRGGLADIYGRPYGE